MNKTFGQDLTPLLEAIEMTIFEYTETAVGPPVFPDTAILSACVIFETVLLDRMWKAQKEGGTPFFKRAEAAEWFGSEIRKIVKQATGIDTLELIKNLHP